MLAWALQLFSWIICQAGLEKKKNSDTPSTFIFYVGVMKGVKHARISAMKEWWYSDEVG